MKIASVEMAGFRGFKARTRFELPPGFAVVTGRNGAGKSTILDAIDFALTGTLNKYSVKGARGGGLDQHIWWVGDRVDEYFVAIEFVDDEGRVFKVRRSRERGLESNLDALGERLCGSGGGADWDTWQTLVQTSLIRDETISALSLDLPEQARFAAVRNAIGGLTGPDHSKRTSTILSAAKEAKSVQDGRAAEAQAELGRALSALTEARSAAERQPSAQDAEKIISEVAPEMSQASLDTVALYLTDLRRRARVLNEVLQEADRLEAEAAFVSSDQFRQELARKVAAVSELKERRDEGAKALEAAESELKAAQEADAAAAHLSALLDHGEALGLDHDHCPLCSSMVSNTQFANAISAAREKLQASGSQVSQATKRRDDILQEFGRAVVRLELAEAEHLSTVNRQKNLSEARGALQEQLAAAGLLGVGPGASAIRQELLITMERGSRLEHGLTILQSSDARDRVLQLEAKIVQLRENQERETARVHRADRALEAAKQIDASAKSVANEVLTEQFDTVLPLLKELYRRLRPHTDWREIETDFGGAVRASLNFSVGDGKNPQFLFSSGQRRAAGMAFLLAIHLSRPWCRLRTLMLDDPIQHIDDYRALNLVEVLGSVRRTGRQVIVAVEDSALADVLCRRLRASVAQPGARFDLAMSEEGSAMIDRQQLILPLPQDVLELAKAS